MLPAILVEGWTACFLIKILNNTKSKSSREVKMHRTIMKSFQFGLFPDLLA